MGQISRESRSGRFIEKLGPAIMAHMALGVGTTVKIEHEHLATDTADSCVKHFVGLRVIAVGAGSKVGVGDLIEVLTDVGCYYDPEYNGVDDVVDRLDGMMDDAEVKRLMTEADLD